VTPILFSYDVFAEQVYGGVSRYFAELHAGLLRRGHSSWILTGLYVNEYVRTLPHVVGVHVPPWRPGTVRMIGAGLAAKVLERVWTVRTRAIYHKTYYGRHRPPSHSPVVVTVYDMIHERFPASFKGDSTPARKKWWCERADLILAISQRTKDDIVELLGTDPQKIVVTPLAHTKVTPTPGRIEPAPYFLYVGDRRTYKNFERTATAFARARTDARLVCFGGGPLGPSEEAHLVNLGIRARVTQLGGSDGDLARLYAGAIALVYPSEYEGFGLPPLEAMAHDCPVCCSNGGSIPEVVGDAAILFDPTSVDAITDALERVMHDRERLIARGRERRTRFSWDATVDLTVQAYERLQ
jgi:glycosyltransferase involved in cell wall biosynthesis